MTNKVLILRWAGSAYDSLGGLLELMGQELTALGMNVAIFAADGPDWPKRLIPVLAQGDIAFALTMSGIGTDLLLDGKLVWEAAKIPLFNWSCDHPCYFPARHGIRNPFLLQGYVFPDHARYTMHHLHPNGAAFAVHLGIPPTTLFRDAPRPLASRNGRILFTKSGQDTNQIEAAWRGYNADMQQILFTGAEELFNRRTADFLPVIQRLAEPHGLFLHGDSRLALLLIREIDDYIRYRRANMVVTAIRRYPVDVFGNGWDHIHRDDAAARFHGAIPWRQTIEQLPGYLGCLSVNPLTDESVHDRVFFALAAGVAPISDGNGFMQAVMPALAPYCYGFTRERIEQAVEAVLAAPEDAVARTDETLRALAMPFGMRRAAQKIVQFSRLHGFNAPCGA